jgi:hypothetical protein
VVVVVHFFGVGLGLRLGFVVVVTGFFTGLCTTFRCGRTVLTLSETSACQATLVPGAGVWCRTTIHFPSVLPGPEVVKKSWARSMTA